MAPRHQPKARAAARRAPEAARRPAARAAAPLAPSPEVARDGRRAALVLAGTGLAWALAIWAGGALDLPERVRALLDLFALAGFGLGLWMTYRVWRARQRDAE